MKEKIKNIRYGIIILIVAILVSIPLCWKNLNYYKDDGIQHIARAFLTSEAMQEGKSFQVLSRLENGFGYSWDLFYGPFSSFSIAIIGNLFHNIIVGYKIVLFLGMLFSGIAMYYFVQRITDDKNAGVLASILYMTMPYHLTDMYLRGSIGEFLSFIFIPLVFLGVYHLFHEEKRDWLLVIGAVGLIITHNLMTMICALVAFVYVAINLPKLKVKKIREKFFFNIIFILCISSFFWVPFLETSMSARYEVYEPGKMATAQSVQENGILLRQLVVTYNDGSYVFEFGPHILIMICFTIAAFRRIVPEMKKEYIFFLLIGILSTFMATKYFPWKWLGEKASFIQFPWRMLEISTFCFSIICAINLGIVIKNFKFVDVIVLGSIAVIYAFALKGFAPITEEKLQNPKDMDFEFVTGRNTDCLVGMGKNEYLPKNVYDEYFYLANRENTILVLEGEANIENYKKDGNQLSAKIEVIEKDTLLELPYVYYPGFTATIDGAKIPTFESKNGFVAVGLGKLSKADLKVEYTGTSGSKVAKTLSIISTILFGVYVIAQKFEKE
ncbi:MAG: glycosyltransferase family 39 protein [Clostridia bacterium]|nr:glycosyltransferase family 39 protein [Clostridia bacterium]